MKKSKSIIIIMLLILLILAESVTAVKAESSSASAVGENGTEVIVEVEKKEIIEAGVPITLDILVKNENLKLCDLDCYIELNTEVFEPLTIANFSTELDTFIFEYDEEIGNLIVSLNNEVNEGTFATVTLMPKVTINTTEIDQQILLLKVAEMTITAENFTSELIEELESSMWIIGKKPVEELYLSTDNYKIGTGDIKNYKEGDKYITRVGKETTLKVFKDNLKTNGTIKVVKADGTELKDTELVGTGMKLVVTKEDVETVIELPIAVVGDLDGNGKVTATDLSTINQMVLKITKLENVFFIAADTDENDNITATDLSTINQMVLKLI